MRQGLTMRRWRGRGSTRTWRAGRVPDRRRRSTTRQSSPQKQRCAPSLPFFFRLLRILPPAFLSRPPPLALHCVPSPTPPRAPPPPSPAAPSFYPLKPHSANKSPEGARGQLRPPFRLGDALPTPARYRLQRGEAGRRTVAPGGVEQGRRARREARTRTRETRRRARGRSAAASLGLTNGS